MEYNLIPSVFALQVINPFLSGDHGNSLFLKVTPGFSYIIAGNKYDSSYRHLGMAAIERPRPNYCRPVANTFL
jgi:hypothetical protein